MARTDEGQEGLPPSLPTRERLQHLTRGFDDMSEAIAAAILVRDIGVQQETCAHLDAAQKNLVSAFGNQVIDAVADTKRMMKDMQFFADVLAEVRAKGASCVKAPAEWWQNRDARGQKKAKAFIRHMYILQEGTAADYAEKMSSSMQMWERVGTTQEDLLASLSHEVAVCQNLIAALQKSIWWNHKMRVVATCTLCVLGVPIAVLCSLPMFAGCLISVGVINAVGAAASFGLGKFMNYYKRKEQKLKQAKEVAEHRKLAAETVAQTVEVLGKLIKDELGIEANLRDTFQTWEKSEKSDEPEIRDMCSMIWHQFKAACTEEDVISLCAQTVNTKPVLENKDKICEMFLSEAIKLENLKAAFRECEENVHKIQETMLGILPLSETLLDHGMDSE